MWWGSRKQLSVGTGLVAIFIIAATAHAQNREDGGFQADLTISQRLSWSDNADFVANGASDLRSLTSLTFDLASIRRAEEFRFSLGGTFEAGDAEDVFRPLATLLYSRESAGAQFDLSLSFREQDVADFDLLSDPNDATSPESLSLDGGQRQDFRGRIGFEFGRDAPFGGTFSYERRVRDFVNTLDPNLFDADTNVASASFRFDLNPLLSLSVFANERREDEDPGGTDTESSSFGLGLTATFNPTLQGSFQVSQDEVETTVAGFPSIQNDGLSYSASLTRDLPNGLVSAAFDGEVTENGRRNELSLRRFIELRDGSFDVSVGAVDFPTGQTRGLFNLSYSQDFARTRWSAAIAQSASTTDTIETLNTQFQLSVAHDLTPVASLSSSLQFAEIDSVGAGGADTSRVDLSLTYRHELAQDWDFVGGVTHRRQETDTAATVTSNSVFVGLTKSLSWRP